MKLRYRIAVSKCASFVFVGHFNRTRRRTALGGTVQEVVHSYGSRRFLCDSRPSILLPRFDYRSLERAFAAEVYRTKMGVGIVRSTLKRSSVSAALGVCTSIAGRVGTRRFGKLSDCFGMWC